MEIDRPPVAASLAVRLTQFLDRFPGQEAAALSTGYTASYDCSPDGQPLLGPVPGVEGLYVAAGFSGHGFQLSPAVGEFIADTILDGRTSLIDSDLFSPGRFAE